MIRLVKLLDFSRLGFIAIFFALLTFTQLVDPDYFWHLRTGQYLFEHGSLPVGDVFSYTQAGKYWVLHEWLFELVLYGLYSQLGELGIKLLVSMLATSTLAISYATAKRMLGRPRMAFVMTLLCFGLVAGSISPRPQLVTFQFFAIFLWVLLGVKYFGANRGLVILPLLMVAWVNFHGGYVIGLVLLFLFTFCEWIGFLAVNKQDVLLKRRLQWLGIAAIATLLASAANPYFIRHWLYPFQVMGMEYSLSYISEWRSPDFHHHLGKAYLVLVIFFFLCTVCRLKKPDLTELAIPTFFIFMGFVSARHVPLAVMAVVPFVAVSLKQEALTQILPSHWQSALIDWYGRWFRQGNDLGHKEYLLNWLVLVGVVAGYLLGYPVCRTGCVEGSGTMVPVNATEFLIKEGVHGRMFNSYDYGGYLINRLYPVQKVFIDGRADMYGDAFVKEYGEISGGRADWRATFYKYQIDYVVIKRDSPLRQMLLAQGDFKLVYDDDVAAVLLKNNGKYAAIIARHSR